MNRKFDEKFRESREDTPVYIRHQESDKPIVALYVDDEFVASRSAQEMDMFIGELHSWFKIADKEPTYFLGPEISQIDDNIAAGQSACVTRILERFSMTGFNPVPPPIEKLTVSASGKASVNFPYRSAVRAFLHLARGTRFPIAFPLASVYCLGHRKILHSRMSVGSNGYSGILLAPQTFGWFIAASGGYSDADFAECQMTLRSTSEVTVKLADAAITWFSRR